MSQIRYSKHRCNVPYRRSPLSLQTQSIHTPLPFCSNSDEAALPDGRLRGRMVSTKIHVIHIQTIITMIIMTMIQICQSCILYWERRDMSCTKCIELRSRRTMILPMFMLTTQCVCISIVGLKATENDEASQKDITNATRNTMPITNENPLRLPLCATEVESITPIPLTINHHPTNGKPLFLSHKNMAFPTHPKFQIHPYSRARIHHSTKC